jgi:DNA-directed RNA polymerase specialized sigma subunit
VYSADDLSMTTTTTNLSPLEYKRRIAELEAQLAELIAERDRAVLEHLAGEGGSRRNTAREFDISVARVQQIASRPRPAA